MVRSWIVVTVSSFMMLITLRSAHARRRPTPTSDASALVSPLEVSLAWDAVDAEDHAHLRMTLKDAGGKVQVVDLGSFESGDGGTQVAPVKGKFDFETQWTDLVNRFRVTVAAPGLLVRHRSDSVGDVPFPGKWADLIKIKLVARAKVKFVLAKP